MDIEIHGDKWDKPTGRCERLYGGELPPSNPIIGIPIHYNGRRMKIQFPLETITTQESFPVVYPINKFSQSAHGLTTVK